MSEQKWIVWSASFHGDQIYQEFASLDEAVVWAGERWDQRYHRWMPTRIVSTDGYGYVPAIIDDRGICQIVWRQTDAQWLLSGACGDARVVARIRDVIAAAA